MNQEIRDIKIIIVGDSGVGKSSIIEKYCYNKFITSQAPTLGCEFTSKIVTSKDAKRFKLVLWDIAGIFNLFYLQGQ